MALSNFAIAANSRSYHEASSSLTSDLSCHPQERLSNRLGLTASPLTPDQSTCDPQMAGCLTPDEHQSQIFYGQGMSLLRSGYYHEAIAAFERAIALNSTLSEAWYSRGDALANLTQYEAALASFDHALELNPYGYEAWTFRGIVLLHLSRYAAALASFNQALSLKSDHEEAWIFRGAALQKLCRYREAYTSYEHALHPQSKAWWQWISELFTTVQQVSPA